MHTAHIIDRTLGGGGCGIQLYRSARRPSYNRCQTYRTSFVLAFSIHIPTFFGAKKLHGVA